MNEIKIQRTFIKTNITALKVLKDVILIGTGGYLIIYNRNDEKIVQNWFIFDETISGIDFDENKILIYGENKLVLYELKDDNQIFKLNEFIYNDWILSAKIIDQNQIILVSIHSEAVILKNFSVFNESKSTEICTCYCCHLVNKNWDDLYVLSGTAFSEVFIWKPALKINDKSPVLYKLKGHKGVIFSIDYSEQLKMICTTSDDGKAIIWKVENVFNQRKNVEMEIKKTEMGIKTTEMEKIEIEKKIFNKKITYFKEIQHKQRVFKCKFFKTNLITVLEDSTIKIYNENFESKTSTHQIGPIWCLDFCEIKNLVFTGGADGGVISTPLEFNLISSEKILSPVHLKDDKNKRYKDFILLNHQIGAGITNIGELNLIDIKINIKNNTKINTINKNNHNLIEKHPDLNSYGLIKKSPCNNLICLAGIHGNIHLYHFKNDNLHYKISCEIKNQPKIYSLHWLSCKSFLTCINDGILILWYYNKEELKPIQFFQLPLTKERWSTSACYCGGDFLTVGDRKGNLCLFDLKNGDLVEILKKVQPMGVTHLYFNSNREQLIVLGRNSILLKYHFNSTKNPHLTLLTKDKLPFTWLGAYHIHNKSEIILGFSTDKFIIWNQTLRRNIFEISCGGGHRLWDYQISENLFTLVYQKVDKLISIGFNFENEIKNVIEGFHGTETNSMKLISINGNNLLLNNETNNENNDQNDVKNDKNNVKSDKNNVKSDETKCLLISGGEDTTLRLSTFNFNDKLNGFKVINTIKSHLSSIRVITYHKLTQNEYFIYSGGGRAQIILWKLNILQNEIIFKEIFSYYKELNEWESEIRIMDLTTIQINDKIILFSGCSNGEVKIYQTELNDSKITYLFNIFHKKRCILKLFIIKFNQLSFLSITSTDGFITFFNLTDFLLNQFNINENIDINTKNIKIPFLTSIKTNQSGINSISFCHISNSDNNKAVILTGGDDKAFSLNLIECTDEENVKISRLGYYSDENYHFAHITGVYITNKYFITASIDQKVIVFDWKLEDNCFGVKEICRRFTHVTDLQGIDCIVNTDSDKLELVLFGNGFEIFTLYLS